MKDVYMPEPSWPWRKTVAVRSALKKRFARSSSWKRIARAESIFLPGFLHGPFGD